MKPPLDLTKLKVYPLAERASEARLEEILVSPDAEPAACSSQNQVKSANVPGASPKRGNGTLRSCSSMART